MKIKSINATPIRIPLQRTFAGATYEIKQRCTIITEIITDDGITGKIFLGDERDRQGEVVNLIKNKLAPILADEDPLCIKRCWHKMLELTRRQGDRAVLCEAIAAVDVALWDLLGKACNKPVYKLIGGFTNNLKPIVITGYYQEDKEDKGLAALCDEIVSLSEEGFAGAKVKVGGLSPLEDVRRIEAIRKSVGQQFILACDANQGWTRFEAVQFGRGVKELGIEWFEEPVQWDDYIGGMKYVRERTGLPVTAGQSEFFHTGCKELLEGEAVDILNYDVSFGPGITDWLSVAKMAELYKIRMAHHEEPLVSMHLLAGSEYGLYPEYFSKARDPLTPQIVINQPKVERGKVELPDRPGFGLEFDDSFVRRYKVD
jgi:D-galactarolactone cycloisomerase